MFSDVCVTNRKICLSSYFLLLMFLLRGLFMLLFHYFLFKVLLKVYRVLFRVLSGRFLSFSKKLVKINPRCHSLSLVVTLCHSLLIVVPLVVTRCNTRWHSLSLVFIRCHPLYYSLSLDVSPVCLFLNDPKKLSKKMKKNKVHHISTQQEKHNN